MRLIHPVRLAVALVVAAFTIWLVPVARAASWQRPVPGPVVRPFGVSADRYARGQHRGVDLAAPLGTPVHAACGGRVRFAGRVPGGGRTVSVGCGPLVATYQHLGAVAVRRGQMLVPGGAVGDVGRSGRPRGRRPHLHLGAREAASGRYLDPLTLLGAVPRPVPPIATAPRRPVPLGPAPRSASRRPLLRPAPARSPEPVAEPPPAAAPGGPVVAWIGAAAFGLGLPLGGLARVRRRRRSTGAPTTRARRWAWAHR